MLLLELKKMKKEKVKYSIIIYKMSHTIIQVEAIDGSLNVSDFLDVKLDYTVKKELYTPYKTTLAVYDLIRQIMVDDKKTIKSPIITLSPDSSISAATLAGVAEKFMYSETKDNKVLYNTNIHVLYIDSLPDLAINKENEYNDYKSSVLSDVIGRNNSSYSLHRVSIPHKNITILGIDEQLLDDEQEYILNSITHYDLKTIKQKGLIQIMDRIVDTLKYENVHVVLDLSCIEKKSAPSVVRDGDRGFDIDQLLLIVQYLKKINIHGIDITGYNFGKLEEKELHTLSNTITIKTIESVIMNIIEMPNMETTKFLIWRKVNDIDPIGWYIMRDIPEEQKDELLNSINNDQIIFVPIDDNNDALVTTTTIGEQQQKSYYTATTFNECCLYPGEKLNMIFELCDLPNIKVLTKENDEINNFIQITLPEYNEE